MADIKDTGIYLDFGVFDSTEWREDSAAEIYERRLEMAEFADKNDGIGLGAVGDKGTALFHAVDPAGIGEVFVGVHVDAVVGADKHHFQKRYESPGVG